MNPARRMLAFALVPLSAMPFAAMAPRMVPMVSHRVQELRFDLIGGRAPVIPPPPIRLRRLAPPWPEEHAR